MKKIDFLIISLILFFIILSFYLILQTRLFGEKTIDPYALVVIPQNIADELNKQYEKDSSNEFLFCLKGNYKNGKYIIKDLYEPKVKSIHTDIFYEKCPKFNILGTIHSHILGSCSLSRQDVYTFGSENFVLTGVMCGLNTFTFHSAADVEKVLAYKIE